MREYELYLPVTLNDGSPLPDGIVDRIIAEFVEAFGGVTFFPQENEGRWRLGHVEFRDKVVIFRTLTPRVRYARRVLRRLKAQLMVELRQESILVVEKRADVL